MSPLAFLYIAIVVTAGAVCADVVQCRQRRRALRHMAAAWELHYTPDDRFGLTSRLAANFPIPGAADLRAVDLVYGTEDDFYRYLLTAEFTTGVLHSKRRRRRVCTFRESKSAGTNTGESRGSLSDDLPKLVLADAMLPVMEQYQKLYESEIVPRRSR